MAREGGQGDAGRAGEACAVWSKVASLFVTLSFLSEWCSWSQYLPLRSGPFIPAYSM